MPTDQGPTRGCPGALQLAPGMEAYVQVRTVPKGTGFRRGRQLCRAADVGGRGPILYADHDQSRSALIGDPVHCINEAE
jgi:hypothetical protein